MPNSTPPPSNQPKDFFTNAREGADMLRLALNSVPDNDWGNKLLKWQAGEYLKKTVPTDTLSGALMHRCIDQRITPFTEKDLAAINPELVTVLQETMRHDPRIQQLKPGQQLVWSSLHQGDSHFTIDIQNKTPALRRDLGRALGNVTIKRNMDGSFSLIDYFDFKNPNDKSPEILEVPGRQPVKMRYEGEETPKKLLGLALRWYESAGGASNNNVQLALGRIFCPEPENNKAGPKSIPVAINFSADEIVSPLTTPAAAKPDNTSQSVTPRP